ncbi:outer membrane murein-binding lipoprotein Lpp [Bradyrhizobium sp. USDA 3686]
MRRRWRAESNPLPKWRKLQVRIINCGLMLGILAACSGQAHADDNVTTEIQSLKAKLKELQQRVDSEARKTATG